MSFLPVLGLKTANLRVFSALNVCVDDIPAHFGTLQDGNRLVHDRSKKQAIPHDLNA